MSLIPMEEALAGLLAGAEPVGESEHVPLREALGRVLATDVVALRTQPDFDASAMDGYALRAADTEPLSPALRILGEAAAGTAFAGTVNAGEAVRIFTGAPVPQGADTILIQEDAERLDGGLVRALEAVAAGQHIRLAGNDFRRDDRLLPQGMVLTPGSIALAASGGYPHVPVYRRPKVAILATGSELVEPGREVGPSQIVASNSYGLAALVQAHGGEVLDLGIAPDSIEAITSRLGEALTARADILVTIGGASVGDHDLAALAFAKMGTRMDFWKVAMRPGKPLMAGSLGGARVIGLPGNPASCMVAATLFLRPLLRKLASLPDIPEGVARLATDMPENGPRAHFLRSTLRHDAEGPPTIHPLDRQDSSLLSIYANATVLLVRAIHAPPASAGESVRYIPLD